MTSQPFSNQTVHSLFDVDDTGGLTLPAGVFIACCDGCLEVDRPIRYRVDEPIPPLRVSDGRRSVAIQEGPRDPHTARRFVVTIDDRATLILRHTAHGWVCHETASHRSSDAHVASATPAKTTQRNQLATDRGSQLAWTPAPDNEAIFRGPYAGYRIVELDRFGELSHCCGDCWDITGPEPICFSVRSTSFYKRAGYGQPLYVRFRRGVVQAYQVVDEVLYVANIPHLDTWPPAQPFH